MLDAAALLTRAPHAGRPRLPVVGDMALTLARVHEICGAARRTLALAIAAATSGPVLWIAPAWASERLNGPGVSEWIDPGRLILVHPRRSEDLLWATEESLRAGAVAAVIVDLPEPPPLTPVRRLHLAAETGAAEGRTAPIGLLLTTGDGGAAGIESRWRLDPRPSEHATRPAWRLARLRARSEPPADWDLTAERVTTDNRLRLCPGEAHARRTPAPTRSTMPRAGAA